MAAGVGKQMLADRKVHQPLGMHRFGLLPWNMADWICLLDNGVEMGRNHTFMDREFGRSNYDSDDQGEFEKGFVFVIMPFKGQEMEDAYAAIKDECKKLKLRSNRVDENTGSGIIIREITDSIERCEFIICDLTDEKPNVYYELGYAHGVGNESSDIILIAKEGSIIHFDIGSLRVNFYSSSEHLRKIVSTNLKAMIKATWK